MWANTTYKFNNGQYIYFQIAGGNTYWTQAAYVPKFNWYWDSGSYNTDALGTAVPGTSSAYYYAIVPNAYTGYIQICRMNASNTGQQWNYSSNFEATSDRTKNCLYSASNCWDGCSLSITTYAPPAKSIALSYDVTPSSGSGTEGDPYIVPTGTTVRVTAAGTSELDDPDITKKYKWDSGSYGTTAYKDLSCSTHNTVYSTTVSYKNYISSTASTNDKSATVYFKAISSPSLVLNSVSPTALVSGNDVTITTTRSFTSNTITYEYTTNNGSTWNSLTPKSTSNSGQTAVWTIPEAHGNTQTYKFRAKITADGLTTSASDAVSAYGTKTIHVKNSNNWGTMYIHAWGAGGDLTSWPGVQNKDSHGLSCTNVGGGLWWDVTITSQATGFLLDANEDGNLNQTANLSYGTFTHDRCVAISTDKDGDWKRPMDNTAVDCLDDAEASTADAASILRTSATLGGSVDGNGNDKIISYGYYYTNSSALSSSNVIGTRVEVGTTADKSGAFSKSQTGLTANTTYYVMAYVKNGNGEAYGDVVSFTTLAQYTVSTGVVTGQSARGSVFPASVTCSSAEWSSNVTANANEGYEFNSWTTGDGVTKQGTTSPTKVKATQNSTIKASFNEVLRTVGVTVNNSYLGSVDAASLTSVGPETESAEVEATAETGATFSNWTLPSGVTAADGYSASSNPIKVNATKADKTITANFSETMHTVTMNSADGSKGTVDASSASVGQITAVAISATPKSGFMFTRWVKTAGSGTVKYYTGAGNGQVEDASGEEKEETYICVTGDVTLQATWEPDRSSGYVVHYGNSGYDADGNSAPSQARPWKDGKLYRATTAASDVSYFSFTAGVGDVDKVIYFKIWDLGSNWYGYSSASGDKFSSDITNVTLNTSYGDARMCIIMPGTYRFTWNKSTKQLSVAYPNDVYYVRGGFNSWDWSHPMSETSSGVYEATINMTEANHTYSGDNGFKVLIAGKYYGKNTTTVTRYNSTGSADFSPCAIGEANIGLTTDYTGNYTFRYTVASNTLHVTYPTAHKVTYGKGSVDGSSSNCSAVDIDNSSAAVTSNSTWVKSGNRVVLTAPVAKTGYTYDGWFANNAGSGAAITTNANCTITVNSADITRYACYHANTYTVSFNVNGGTASTPDSKVVTYDAAYGELPGGMTHASKTFKGWFTLSSGGTLVTAETIVNTADNHTLYAQYEGIYRVDVDFKCGDAKLYPSTSVNASATALAAEISAPEILGYEFANWSGSNATFGDASSATTTVKATAATTITANYTAIPTVYFKNNLGWEKVYVTFACGWTGTPSVPTNDTKPYFEMEQLGTSDIFSCRIPDEYVTSAYAGWANNIAFDNHGFEASENVGSHDGGFNAGEFLGRGDFDPSATMFIPYDGDSETRNSGTYYRTGCWMKYNSTDPGYKVHANTYKSGEGGSVVDGTPVLLKADMAGGFEFKAKVSLGTANYTYGFMLHKEYTKNSDAIWYTNTGTITAATDDLPWHFYTDGASENGERCGIHTDATGDYEITVSFGTGRPVVDVTYPVSEGDWRLAYNDRIAWSGDAHADDWYIYSRVIKAKANAEDIVSFYVSKAIGANAHIELQKCTDIDEGTGAEIWKKQGDNLDLSSISETGIYNFKVTQNGSKVATAAYDGDYDGNFYIRTDASDGGWTNYISSGTNVMTYSEYAKDNSEFTHYYMRFVTTGSNIKFCIANDYSPCLTEYCVSDDYTNEWIEANGNVRFMWDQRTNEVSRAYISGSSIVSDRFLVLEGDAKMFDEDGNALSISGLNANEMKFTDDQNWIYEATVKAQPGARIKLTAKYNNKIQYFYGDEGERTDENTELLIGGSGTDKYKVRVVYDFKTNRLMKAFMPDDGTITTDLEIETDLMIVREHQENAKQIIFSGDGALSKVKTVYGAMKFNKYTVNGKSKEEGHASTGASRYERDLFYISFPFDVKLGDAFGFGTYGKHWIIEYYDGADRASTGYWADNKKGFWKFVMPAQRHDFTMKAFEGYILALDLDEMTEGSSVWDNGVEDVYVYFPSSAEVEDIEATNRLIPISQNGYQCTIGPRPGMSDDRRLKDSYWHCIGVPSFANYSRDLSPTNGGDPIDWSDGDGEIDWSTPSLPYLYTVNWSDNSLNVTTSATFNFKATWSYMVQYAGESIYWSQVNVTPSSVVAHRKSAPTNVEFRIELQQEGKKADQTFVRLTNEENVTTGFDFNYDLSKEFNKNKANIYSLVSTMIDDDLSITQSAGNVLPMSDAITTVPLGVKIATAGDYTFAIPSGTSGVGVKLYDNETSITTDLSAGLTYTIDLGEGTHDGRFVLEISPIKQVVTGIEEGSGLGDQDSAVRKVMVDGILYIVKDNKLYDARGARVE